jgi:23S rRNA (adenine-N6)-dimethyltransferase
MAKKPHNPLSLAQNFFRSPTLVRRLVDISSIKSSDTVCEIGPGSGMITKALAQTACQVIAVEKDPRLAEMLRQQFKHTQNVEIVEGDFLQYPISKKEYKIFANIPYNITADIIRKILYDSPFPSEAYLVIQKEAAQKFAGCPRECQFSILIKPFFELQILRKLRRTDFMPVPQVDSVLLHIEKRQTPLIREREIFAFRKFVRYGFRGTKKNLKLAFNGVFTYHQWKRLAKALQFRLDATPTELTFEQWMGLYACFKQKVPVPKQAVTAR